MVGGMSVYHDKMLFGVFRKGHEDGKIIKFDSEGDVYSGFFKDGHLQKIEKIIQRNFEIKIFNTNFLENAVENSFKEIQYEAINENIKKEYDNLNQVIRHVLSLFGENKNLFEELNGYGKHWLEPANIKGFHHIDTIKVKIQNKLSIINSILKSDILNSLLSPSVTSSPLSFFPPHIYILYGYFLSSNERGIAVINSLFLFFLYLFIYLFFFYLILFSIFFLL
jgi:hypothetical protein